MQSVFNNLQAVLEEFAGLDASEQAVLLEAWQPPTGTPRGKVGVVDDPPAAGPSAKRHKGS